MNYKKGRELEYRARKAFEEAGAFAIRSAGSKSIVDIVAFIREHTYFIQCKADGALFFEEWNKLYSLAEKHGAIPVFATKSDRGRLVMFEMVGKKEVRGSKALPCKQLEFEKWNPK